MLSTSAGPSSSPKIAVQRHLSHVQPGKYIHLQMDQQREEGEDSSQFIHSNSMMELEKNTSTGVAAAHPASSSATTLPGTGRYEKLPQKADFFCGKLSPVSLFTTGAPSSESSFPRPLGLFPVSPLGEATPPVSDGADWVWWDFILR